MNSNNDFWLIDSNFVGVMRIYKDKEYSDKSIVYMFIEEGIIMGIYGENPPLMKTKKKILTKEARLLWQKLFTLLKMSSEINLLNKIFCFLK